MTTFEQKIKSTFTIQGKISYKEKPKMEIKESHKNGGNWKGYMYQIGIAVNGGLHFVDFFNGDSYTDYECTKLKPVKYKKDGNDVILDEQKALDPIEVENAPNWLKRQFNDKQYLYAGMFSKDVYDNLESLKDRIVNVYGNIEYTYNKDKNITYTRLKATRISVVEDNSPQFASGNLQLVVADGSVGDVLVDGQLNIELIKEMGGKIPVRAYIPQANREANTRDSVPTLYFPNDFVINTNKMDLSNEMHQKILKFMVGQCVPQTGKINTVGFKVQFVKGSVEVELTEEQKNEMLTPQELEYISLFPDKKEEFLRKKMSKETERVDDIYLKEPHPSLPVSEEVEELTFEILELHKTVGAYSAGGQKSQPAKPQPAPQQPVVENSIDYGSFFGF